MKLRHWLMVFFSALNLHSTLSHASQLTLASLEPYINSFNQSDYEVAGSCSELKRSTVTILISDGSLTLSNSARCRNGHFKTSFNMLNENSALKQGDHHITVVAKAVDLKGHKKIVKQVVSSDTNKPSIEITSSPEQINSDNQHDYTIYGICGDQGSGLQSKILVSVWDGRNVKEVESTCSDGTFKASVDTTTSKPRHLQEGVFNISISASGMDFAGNRYTASTSRSKNTSVPAHAFISHLAEHTLVQQLIRDSENSTYITAEAPMGEPFFRKLASLSTPSPVEMKIRPDLPYLRFKMRPGDTIGGVLHRLGMKRLWASGGSVEKTISLNPNVLLDSGNVVSSDTMIYLPVVHLSHSDHYHVNERSRVVTLNEPIVHFQMTNL